MVATAAVVAARAVGGVCMDRRGLLQMSSMDAARGRCRRLQQQQQHAFGCRCAQRVGSGERRERWKRC